MGGGSLSSIFKNYARMAPDGSAIVELGTWVGAGTLPLIQGVSLSGMDVEIHSYDNFIIRGNEVTKAAKFGIKLKDGQDSLPLVKKWLSGYSVTANLHKGEITNNTWGGRPIYIYIDDACKYEKNFMKALKIFSPYWIPGETIIVLQDFFFYKYRPNDKKLEFQKKFMDLHSDKFELIVEKFKLATAIFRYKGGLEL